MANYGIGSTGVAELHVGFTKQSDLVTLPQNTVKQSEDNYLNLKFGVRIFKENSNFEIFARMMNKRLDGRKRVSSVEIKKILSEISYAVGIGVPTLKKRYLERYCKKFGVSVSTYRNEKKWQYERHYQQFKDMRDKHPNVRGNELKQLHKKIATNLGVLPKTLSSARYEYKWRQEHEAE